MATNEEIARWINDVRKLFLMGDKQIYQRIDSSTRKHTYTRGQTQLAVYPDFRTFSVLNTSPGEALDFRIEKSRQGQGLQPFMEANPDVFGYVEQGSLNLTRDVSLSMGRIFQREVFYEHRFRDSCRVLYLFPGEKYPVDECFRAFIDSSPAEEKGTLASMFFAYEPVNPNVELPKFPEAIPALIRGEEEGRYELQGGAENYKVIDHNPELALIHRKGIGHEFVQIYKLAYGGDGFGATLYLGKDGAVSVKQRVVIN